MDKVQTHSGRESFILFIQKFRGLIITIGVILVTAVVVAIVLDEVQKSRLATSSGLIERLNDSYAAWTSAADADKESKKKDFDTAASDASGFGAYPKQRADYLNGEILFANKDYAGAETRFIAAVDEASDTYLAPVALMNAAVASEENGKIEESKKYLKRLADSYAKTSSLAPRALFNLGRLAESAQQWKDAQDNYQKIVDNYADSSWTKLARDRIIYLKVQNKT